MPHLRIERNGAVLFEGEVATFEYAEKEDGSVSVVGRPAVQRAKSSPSGGGWAELLRGASTASKRRPLESVQQTPVEVSPPEESTIDLGEQEPVEQTD